MDTINVSVGFQPLNQEAFLSELKLRLYWDRVRDLPEKVKGGIEAIRYSEDAPQNVVTYVKDDMIRLRRVFESATEGIPLEVTSDPIRFHLRPNAVTKRCPQPILGHGAKAAILTKWARQQIQCGMFRQARDSPWASRPHIAHKTIRGTSNDADVFDIRIVGDYVYVNSQIVRLQPNGPHAMSQIRHAAGHHAYCFTDGDQQYQGWALHEDSQNVLAV